MHLVTTYVKTCTFGQKYLANMELLHSQDAPYLLEPLGSSFADEPVPVRLALLAAVGKLFFKRPPECQRLLGTVLAAAMGDSNQDVHDRALLYYRYIPPHAHIALARNGLLSFLY